MTDAGSPVPPTEVDQRGGLHIANRAIERIATHTATGVAGVQATAGGLDKLVGRTLPRVDLTPAGDHVRLGLEIAVQWPHGAGEVARNVRSAVKRQVGQLTGLNVIAVDVKVVRFASGAESADRRVE